MYVCIFIDFAKIDILLWTPTAQLEFFGININKTMLKTAKLRIIYRRKKKMYFEAIFQMLSA